MKVQDVDYRERNIEARHAGPEHGGPRSEFGKRVIVAVPAIAIGIALIISGGAIFAFGVLLIGLICLHELFRMYETYHPVKLAGYLGLIGLIAAAYWGSERQVLLAAVAFIPALFLLSLLMPVPRGTRTHGMAITALGIFWIGFALAHAILLRELPHGEGILIDVLIGTFIGDTAAYLGGRAFGSHHLAERISPNKTIEGLLIGMVVAVIAVWSAGLYQDWLSHSEALLLGVAVALFAPLGDLFESQVKRDADVKDTGRLLGSHGGLLDRLDASLFTVVAGYYVWLALL